MEPGIGHEETRIHTAGAPTYVPDAAGDEAAGPVLGAPLERVYPIIDVRGGHGVSGMGIIYIVEDAGQRYAVKTFQRRFAQKLEYIQRFIREAKTWMLLGFHPNIAHAYRLDIFEAVPHLFIEYVASDEEGRHTLAHYLKSGPLAPDQVLEFTLQFCDGMLHATRAVAGLVHRDIKPDNLLITPEGRLKVTDFGLVRGSRTDTVPAHRPEADDSESDGALTRAGSVFGTPAYMAPEQFDGAAEVGSVADIYAFGCCMYEALRGTPPFTAKGATTFEQIMHLKRQHLTAPPPPLEDCPTAVAAVVARCLEKDPRDRWADFAALREAAEAAYADCFGPVPLPSPRSDAMPRLVAEQSRSLALLDGYENAIRLNHLRAGHSLHAYAFHLALASYFRYHGDQAEEERQLRKAIEARGGETGYEAVRLLSETLLLRSQRAEAAALLDAFLARCPEGEQYVIEPLVRLACAEGRFDAAAAWITAVPDTTRSAVLQAELLRARGSKCELAALLEQAAETALGRIAEWLGRIQPGDTLGWERSEDPQTLRTVLTGLRPELDLSPLDGAKDAVWPDLCGYPDFAPQMALLSEAFGELAVLESECGCEAALRYGEYAARLGYPKRLKRHLEREEEWFWTRGGAPS